MPEVERTDPDGVDYGWVMQVTFVLTVLVGSPLVAVLSVVQPLPTWNARATFAVRVGAVVWVVTALSTYAYARRRLAAGDPPWDLEGGDGDSGDADGGPLGGDGGADRGEDGTASDHPTGGSGEG